MRVRKVLLVCGILSSVLWIGADIIASMLYESYSFINQSISELSAIGAPTRAFLATSNIIYVLLLFAFGVGVLATGSRKRALRVTGILMMTHAVLALISGLFPMNMRGTQMTISDIMHIIFYTAIPLIILFIIGFGAFVFGKLFRIYSIGTIVVIIMFGALTGMAGPRVAAGLSTPWLGVYERINVYGYMLWVLVLSIILLSEEKGKTKEIL